MASLRPHTVEVAPEVGQRDGQGPGGLCCLPRLCLETVEPGEWWDQVCIFLSRGAGMELPVRRLLQDPGGCGGAGGRWQS